MLTLELLDAIIILADAETSQNKTQRTLIIKQ